MSALGSLVVKLALEYAQFSQGLQSNEQEVKQHAKRVQDTYEQMAAGVADRMDRLKGAVLGAIGGAVSAYGLSSAIAKIKQETIDAEKEQQQLAAAIKSTGGAAGWSVEKLNAMADSLEKNSNFSAGQINQAQARMMSYSGVVGEVMPRAMQAVVDMSERMGYQVTAAAETIGKALEVPSRGMTSLSEQGFTFGAQQKELVKQLERTGQTAAAQGIILDALEASYGGAAKAARDTLGGSMQAVSHSINSLMTADSASMPGLRESIEGLTETLNSDSVRAGFQAFIGAVADVGSFAANSMAQLVRLGQAATEHKGEIAVVLGMLAGAGTAAGALQVAAAIGGAGGVVAALNKARGAVVALSIALAANPATLVLLGIGAATGAAIASNMGDPVGDKLTKEIEYQTQRLAEKEALLAKAGGPKGQLTAKLEASIEGIRAHLKTLNDAAGIAEPAVTNVAQAVERAAGAAADSGTPLAQSEEWLRKYGTAAQKAGVEIDEWKRKLGSAFTPEMEKQVKDLYAKQDEGAKAGAQSAKQLQAAYDGLTKSLAEKITEQKQELQSGEKLTESDKQRIKFSEDLKGSLKGLSTAQRANVLALIDSLAALEKEAEARKLAVRLAEEERKYRQEWWADQARTVDELAAGNAALRDEIELIGLSSSGQAIVLRQRQEAVLLTMEQRLEEMKRSEDSHQFMGRERINLEQNIALMRERLALTSDKGAREASAAASAASAAEWQKGVDQIGQSLTDQLMAGGQSFGDYLKNLARTLVFRPLIQAVVQTSMSGVLGSGGSAGGSGSDPGLLSILSNAKGLMGTNTAGGLAGSFSAGMSGGWAGFEGGISMMQNGSMLSGGAQALGAAAPYIGGLFQMANGKYGSGVGTMAGAYIGSIVPGIGTAIGAVVGSLLGGLLDGEARGANHSGAAASSLGTGNTAAAQKLMQDSRGDWYTDLTERHNAGLETQLSGTVNALAGVYEQLSWYAGSAARQIELVGGFAANSKYGDEGAVGYGQLWDRVSGQYLGGFSNRDLGTDTEKAWTSYVGQMGGLIVAELKASDIPGWMRDQLNAIGDSVTVDGLNQALQAIAAIDLAFKGWADTLTGFAGLSAEVQTALINFSGGIEGLAGNVNAFYEGYYSEAERMGILQRQVLEQLASLDVSVDTSSGEAAKESFRRTVEGALNAGNAELAARLLAMSGSFAAAADYAAKATEEVVQAASKAMEGLLSDRRQLEAELLQAQGDAAGYAAAMRAIATEGYSAAELAAYDYNDALRAQITEAQRAATATQEAAAAMAALRQQADGIVQSQRQSLDSLLAGLQRQAEQASGGYVDNLWLSGAEFTQFAGFADQLDGATSALAQLQALGLGDELAGYADQIGAIVQQTTEALSGALSAQRLLSGDVAGALAAAVSASMVQFNDFTEGGQFNAGAFNGAYSKQRADAAAGLLADAQANSLRIPNSAGVIAQLRHEVMSYTQESVLRDLRVQGAEMFGPMVNGLFTDLWEGMARGAAEGKQLAGDVTAVGWMPGYGTVVGEDLQLVARSIDRINEAFANGRISVDEADAALAYLRETFDGLVPLLSDAAGQFGRAAEVTAQQALSGVRALEGAFGQLSGIVSEMDAAARAANTGLAQAVDAIGLLTSMSTVFGGAAAGSVDAAMSAIGLYQAAAAQARAEGEWDRGAGFDQSAADLAGRLSELRAAESRGALVSESAALAASIVTTASAAQAAQALAGKIQLGEGQTMRDLSLLVDGVAQYDNAAFYEAFARVTDALGKGQIDEAQYRTLFDFMTTTYQGVDQEAERAAQSLASLRSAAGSLADELLLSDFSSFNAQDKAAEAVRQYDEVISAALAGGDVSQSELAKATNTMLQKVSASTTDPLEMERRFGLTINQLRTVEKAPEISPEVKQLQALQKEVALMRTEHLKALALIKDENQSTNRLLREAAAKKG